MSPRVACVAAALMGLASGAPADIGMLQELENMPGKTSYEKLVHMAHALNEASARGMVLAKGVHAHMTCMQVERRETVQTNRIMKG